MKKQNLILIIFVFGIFFALASKAQAKDWYVDNKISTSGNGTSWETAWKNFSNILWSETTNTNRVSPGDTLYISGNGESYKYSNTLNVGANNIIIRVGQTSGHNGQVIFDFNGVAGIESAINIVNRQHITIDGSVGTEAKLMVRNLYDVNNKEGAVAVYGYGNSNITVKYLKTENTNNGVRLASGTGYDINNCYLDGVRGDGGISLLASTGSWDANLIHDNYIGISQSSIGGPDGMQTADGVSIYNNIFKVSRVAFPTSTQHPDDVQSVGGYVKIYNNEFINIGDSALDLAGDYVDPNFHDVWVYNNVFRIEEEIDPYPNYIRVYGTAPWEEGQNFGIDSIVNYKIFNNLFMDNPYWAVNFYSYQGLENPIPADDPTASGNEIKNNIFYNCGNGSLFQAAIQIDDSSKFTNSSFSFGGNIYYHSNNLPSIYFRGVDYPANIWVNTKETTGKNSKPEFIKYVANALDNDFHLKSTDAVAKDSGLNLGSFFTKDKDGVSRPQGSSWDIGPYEYVATQACLTKGDFTCNGFDATDIQTMINIILNIETTQSKIDQAKMNIGDSVDAIDLQLLINKVLNIN